MKLKELNLTELKQINGGSELTDMIGNCIGAVGAFFYYAATQPAIRPSQYR